ncbi:heat shock chaperonin-binding motif containing protein [Aureococcus anophagefferens]|nr:heat shock chaperonin-binding motif containing protein [Aureococcus anophagefferens]
MLPRDLEKHLAFLKDFCESYPPSAAPAAAPAGGGDEPPPPSVPANAAEAPEDADWCAAGEKKSAAAAAAAGGDLAGALALYSEALELEAATACLSATTLAKRGEVLLKLERPRGCASDCAAALALNPDSCKALKVRGKAHAALGDYTAANLDLSKAQSIDFDPDLAELAKDVKDKAAAEATKKVAARNAEELEKRKKAAAAKREREQAAAAAQAKASAPGGMPGMGGMGGMPGAAPAPRGFRREAFARERSETDRAPFLGMGGMPPGAAGMMNDPDVAAAMQNPKVMAALQDMMAGGAPNRRR